MQVFSRHKDICYCEVNLAQHPFVDFFVAQKSIFRDFTKIFVFLVHRFSLAQTLLYRTSTPLWGMAYDLDRIFCIWKFKALFFACFGMFKKAQEVMKVVGSFWNVVQLWSQIWWWGLSTLPTNVVLVLYFLIHRNYRTSFHGSKI